MYDAAEMYDVPVEKISFKGTVQQLNHWLWIFLKEEYNPADLRKIIKIFYEKLTDNLVPGRFGRNEPRVKKRRPKNYQLMTKPRQK